jgi:hypothetical protein
LDAGGYYIAEVILYGNWLTPPPRYRENIAQLAIGLLALILVPDFKTDKTHGRMERMNMRNTFHMTPGPTYVHEDVRRAISKEITNPDLDLGLYEFYKETCDQLKKLYTQKNEILILCGEGIWDWKPPALLCRKQR